MKWLLIGGAALVGWYLYSTQAGASSATSGTPGQPSTLPLSSGSIVPVVGAAPGILDRFIGAPIQAVPGYRPVGSGGVIAQLQADSTQQRLAKYYGANWPARMQMA